MTSTAGELTVLQRLHLLWAKIVKIYPVIDLEQLRELHNDNSVVLFVERDKFVLFNVTLLLKFYKLSLATNTCVQNILQPVIRPGKIHLFLTIEYNERLLQILQRRVGCDSIHSTLIERIHQLLIAFVQFRSNESPETLKRVVKTSAWEVRSKSNQCNLYVAHFPSLCFKNVPHMQSFVMQFCRFTRDVDSSWVHSHVSAPLVINNHSVMNTSNCCVGDVLPVPFMIDRPTDPKRWRLCYPSHEVSMKVFFSDYCAPDAIFPHYMLSKNELNTLVGSFTSAQPHVLVEPAAMNTLLSRAKCLIQYTESKRRMRISPRFLHLLQSAADTPDESFLCDFDRFISCESPAHNPFMQVQLHPFDL